MAMAIDSETKVNKLFAFLPMRVYIRLVVVSCLKFEIIFEFLIKFFILFYCLFSIFLLPC